MYEVQPVLLSRVSVSFGGCRNKILTRSKGLATKAEKPFERNDILLFLNAAAPMCFIFCCRSCMAWSRKHCPGFVRRCYCIINDSSISSPSTAPVSVKPLLLYKFSAWILSLLQVKVTRFEEPKGFVLI